MVFRFIKGTVEYCRKSERDFLSTPVYYVNLEEAGRFFYFSREGQLVRPGQHVEANILELVKRTSGKGNVYPLALSVRIIEEGGIKANIVLEY